MGMTDTNIAMDRFMEKLGNNEYKKVNQPNNGPELTSEFIAEQLQSFTDLLESGIVDAAVSLNNK